MPSIQVGIRARPFAPSAPGKDDRLGCEFSQESLDPPQGFIDLHNVDKKTTRFGYSYCWWSAYNYGPKVVKSKTNPNANPNDIDVCKAMKNVSQEDVFEQCGSKIQSDLLEGSAVVIFAYGLSGSGKTYTVFGSDDVKNKKSWYYLANGQEDGGDMWGIFPRLGYNVMEMKNKSDGWKVIMKYFQNVVDICRDLMCPTIDERSYKSGFKKDEDGFMDIEWTRTKVLSDWDDLRTTFTKANGQKAISPTQFNWQSTRGHCIMTIEVQKPKDDDPNTKLKGRLYVCDLAGTEPAGDIYYAVYKDAIDEDGNLEHVDHGPHPDPKKTKELQDQGKKINLSLTEMGMYFKKMAEAVKKKKLQPGKSIPGCNSYFLCKYLKDTMVMAKTYLFCAVRPEVNFMKYTTATLDFATNASVIKVTPKKATSAASPAERKLLAQVAELQAMVEDLKKANSSSTSGGDTAALEAALAQKQAEMMEMMNAPSGSNKEQEEEMERQKEEYSARGISLTYYDADTPLPHFLNLDEDPFRSKRFLYIMEEGENSFGPGGKVRPMNMTVMRDHCKVVAAAQPGEVTLVGGNGSTFVNGKKVGKDESVVLQCYDRVVMGQEMMLFYSYHDGDHPHPEGSEMDIEDVINEYQEGMMSAPSDGASSEQTMALQAQIERMKKEREELINSGGSPAGSSGTDSAEEANMAMMEKEIAELMPKTKQLKDICNLMGRDFLAFDCSFQRGSIAGSGMGAPTVKVKVTNHASQEHVFIDPFEFTKGFSILRDERQKIQQAIENDREYEIPEMHDPVSLLFDNTFYLGAAVIFPEFLVYMLETDEEDRMQDITSVGQGAKLSGKMEINWQPIGGPDLPEGRDIPVPDILEPEELIGKPWYAEVSIKGAFDLPLMVDVAYCQYEFWQDGELTLFTTDTFEGQGTSKPELNYTFVHTVEKVTQEFIDFLSKPMEVKLYVSPDVVPPKAKVGTSNPQIVDNFKNGYSGSGPQTGGISVGADAAALAAKNEIMAKEIRDLKAEVRRLKTEKKVAIVGASLANKQILAAAGVPPPAGGDSSKTCSIQ